MTQAFLNELSIEAAHERYLKRWHLESVRSAWNGRKPSLAQFKKRFGKDYSKRQAWLARTGQGTSATALAVAEREDVAEAVAQVLQKLQGDDTEPEVENLGSEAEADEDEHVSNILEILKNGKRTTVTKAEKEEAPKFVKPENFNELPRSGQVYFFLHRAQEAGLSYAIVPIKRGVAAEVISQIKEDGRSYKSVATDLIKSK